MEPSELEAAYSAGILDGEGNIHIGMGQGGQYRLQVQAMNTNREVLEWLQSRWGGKIYEMRGNSRHTDWARCWNWALNLQEDKQQFLEATLPYLIIKRRQAEIALRFLQLPRTLAGRRLPPSTVARRRELFLEIRNLPQPDYEDLVDFNDDQLAMELAQ